MAYEASDDSANVRPDDTKKIPFDETPVREFTESHWQAQGRRMERVMGIEPA